MEQLPLFECAAPAPLPQAGSRLKSRAQWSRYRSHDRVQCDDCALVAHEMWPDPAPPIRQARWLRLTKHSKRLLCGEHAGHWRGGNVE